MIPRIVHFCYFGLEPTAEDFPLVYYLAIRSAAEKVQPTTIFFHNAQEPKGKYWEAAKPYLTCISCQAPKEIFGRPLLHYAHQADVVRLQILIETGGIYLDIDTICLQSFDRLLQHPCVMGIQNRLDGTPHGLCNAVMLSQPRNSFLMEWLDTYRQFCSKGRDKFWDEHSVKMPARLARMNAKNVSERGDLHIEPAESFFTPGWQEQEQKRLFDNVEEFPKAYCYHLAETKSFKQYLQSLTEATIHSLDTTYNLAARPFLPGVT